MQQLLCRAGIEKIHTEIGSGFHAAGEHQRQMAEVADERAADAERGGVL